MSIGAVANCPEMVVNSVKAVMGSKCRCMDDEFEGGEEAADEEQEAEQDELLFQCAGEVLPALGMALASPQLFSPYFAGLFANLLKKTKRSCTPAERSFSVGTLAECVQPLATLSPEATAAEDNGGGIGSCLAPFAAKLYQTFLSLMKDDGDEDVRNNAVFGLGELAMHGGPATQAHYPDMLQESRVARRL